mmetsp:Transcript_43921/g.94032  ORF Transcript_43921/g.94032 Transcript_43921/m.94032 type:complete len:301 (-) Transcript_43921:549-1451(-)
MVTSSPSASKRSRAFVHKSVPHFPYRLSSAQAASSFFFPSTILGSTIFLHFAAWSFSFVSTAVTFSTVRASSDCTVSSVSLHSLNLQGSSLADTSQNLTMSSKPFLQPSAAALMPLTFSEMASSGIAFFSFSACASQVCASWQGSSAHFGIASPHNLSMSSFANLIVGSFESGPTSILVHLSSMVFLSSVTLFRMVLASMSFCAINQVDASLQRSSLHWSFSSLGQSWKKRSMASLHLAVLSVNALSFSMICASSRSLVVSSHCRASLQESTVHGLTAEFAQDFWRDVVAWLQLRMMILS